MSDIVFGLSTYKNSVAGVHLQNLTFGENCSNTEAIDEDGNVEQIDVYGIKLTVQGDGNVVSGNTLAVSVGGTISFGSQAYKITDCSKKFSVNGHCTFSFSGTAPKISGSTVSASGGTTGSN